MEGALIMSKIHDGTRKLPVPKYTNYYVTKAVVSALLTTAHAVPNHAS